MPRQEGVEEAMSKETGMYNFMVRVQILCLVVTSSFLALCIKRDGWDAMNMIISGLLAVQCFALSAQAEK